MLKLNHKDNNLRKNITLYEHKFIVFNSIIKDKKIKSSLRWLISLQKQKQFKQNSKTKTTNRCVISGRSRAIYRFAKISRLFLRDNSFIGKIPGLQKSYW
jgi:small subunit ribosomal protein S14